MQETAGEIFYYRLSSAIEAQDLATLETLYHPDATLISLRTGQIIQGRAAIMATITQTLAVASPIKPIAIESFVELPDDIICVEATQSTRFTQNRQIYDIYLLQAGVIRNHFSGMISPRQPAPLLYLGAPATPEQQFHHRYWTARQAHNLAQLRTLYHPDAISISVSGGGSVTRGYDAIENGYQRERSELGPSRLKALTRFIEDANLICTEGTFTIDIDPGMSLSRVPLDLQFYNIFLLQAGVIHLAFSGLISPRPAELKETFKLIAERRRKGLDMIWDAFQGGRRRWR